MCTGAGRAVPRIGAGMRASAAIGIRPTGGTLAFALRASHRLVKGAAAATILKCPGTINGATVAGTVMRKRLGGGREESRPGTKDQSEDQGRIRFHNPADEEAKKRLQK